MCRFALFFLVEDLMAAQCVVCWKKACGVVRSEAMADRGGARDTSLNEKERREVDVAQTHKRRN
jgi:hypothetical protein